jgi:glycosyltransferase
MKVTIITPTFNSAKTLSHNLNSVARQSYKNIEHIIVDGNSSDSTISVVHKNSNKKIRLISEPDNGIYDAMNKGVSLASGDIIAFLNSDDFYIDSKVISDVSEKFSNNSIQYVYGDIDFISK